MEQTYFRKGFGLKSEVKPVIDAEYHSALVERIRSHGYTEVLGDVTVRLAREFGFCYGVDRAVDYAYETVRKFPDRRIWLVGEIIHNPHVNARIRKMGIQILHSLEDGGFDFSEVTADDVVIIPAFGVTLADFRTLSDLGCILVDTTCGSVLVVWKRVDQYARDGFTAVIHGKYRHEESRATASQVNKHPGGKYLIVRDMAEAELVCDYIVGAPGALSRDEFTERFADKTSPGFDPDVDLERIGMANQTTMLAGESLLIGERIRAALEERCGEEHARECFRAFDTLCSATQERQDAVADMMEDPPDIMIVVGGYNSSNTNHLAHLCAQHTRTFHIDAAAKIDLESGAIRHKPELGADSPEVVEENWLPEGPFS
ncbi:MAG TPA: 4-hydroxy-3-methylbut-2-enyl diphosphate reductase, partial [Longimicrobiales bacterium]|nr:4-hydroxy-3-methylbut-2-enyl diphosphate reductase [Longimicrobiales bacterium]